VKLKICTTSLIARVSGLARGEKGLVFKLAQGEAGREARPLLLEGLFSVVGLELSPDEGRDRLHPENADGSGEDAGSNVTYKYL
jgi:hypothetical protein